MQVVHGSETLEQRPKPVITIGNFDGVHVGHRALIERTRAMAERMSVPSGALTFHPTPQEVLRPDSAAPRIQSLAQRIEMLAATGLDYLVVEPFSLDVAALTAEDFAHRILKARLGVRGLALGYDFRFGRGRAGAVDTLKACLDVPIEHQAAVELDGRPVSSSRVRQAVRVGDVALAGRCLGRPHAVRGAVVAGEQRGRKLGFPTANLREIEGLAPARGVYATWAWAEGVRHRAVANLGVRPTVDGVDAVDVVLEVHLLDFAGDLYGASVMVEFVELLRGETAFPDLDALRAQISRDTEAARGWL